MGDLSPQMTKVSMIGELRLSLQIGGKYFCLACKRAKMI